jgi:hypothetical protein
MPIAKIQLPDGRIGRFEVPEGTTLDQVEAFISGMSGGGNAASPDSQTTERPQLSTLANVIGGGMKVAQGLTGGFGDELSGALYATGRTMTSPFRGEAPNWTENYAKMRDSWREAEKIFDKAHPYASTGTEIVSSIFSPIAKIAGPMNAASMVGRAGQAAGAGARIGSVYGLGNAEGHAWDQLKGTATGAVAGGAIGGVAAPVIEGASALIGKAVNSVMSRVHGATPAERKIAALIAEIGGGDINAGMAEVNRRLAAAGPDAALADVLGVGGQRLARAAANVPGQGAQIADDFVAARVAGRSGRLQSAADTIAPRQNLVSVAEQMDNAQRAAARPLYDEAFRANQAVTSPEIDAILGTPAGSGALRQAATMMRNDRALVGKADPELTAALDEAIAIGKAAPGDRTGFGVADGLKLRTLDYVKRALGDMEQTKINSGERDAARIIGDLRRSLTGELDRLDVTAKAGPNSLKPEGGAYVRARGEYGKAAKQKDALELGQAFLREDANVTAAALRGMSDAEKEAFRLGARKAIGDMISSDTQAAVSRFTDKKEALWERLRNAFPDDASFNAFKEKIGSEIKKAQTERFISPRAGSHTTPMAQDIQEMGRVPTPLLDAGMNLLQGRYMTAAGNMLRAPYDWMTRPNAELAGNLARHLLTQTPAANQATLARVGGVPRLPPMNPDQMGRLARALIMGGTVSAASR